MSAPVEYLVVGTVQKPHGIRGELAVRAETDRPDTAFAAGRTLTIGDAKGRPVGGTLQVERARPFKAGVLLKVRELTSLGPEAEALRGRTLLLTADQVAPLEEDEVFVHELVGMEVRAGEQVVGRVRDVYEGPAGHLLAVQRSGRGELIVPFVAALVTRVDRDARVVEIDPPEGLLEL